MLSISRKSHGKMLIDYIKKGRPSTMTINRVFGAFQRMANIGAI